MILPGLEPDEIIMLDLDEDGNVRATPGSDIPAVMTGSEIYRSYFGVQNAYMSTVRRKLMDYEVLATDPLRTAEEDRRMQQLGDELRTFGVAPDGDGCNVSRRNGQD